MLLKYFFQRKPAVLMVGFLAIMAGIWSFYRIPVDIFPNLNYPLMNVITHYPGGSPADIELLITRPIENQMGGLAHVRRISSTSQEGLSEVSVEFDWGIDVKDARQTVAQGLSTVQSGLPQGAISTIENLGSNLQQIMGYGVFLNSEESPVDDLKYLVQAKIANQLKSVPGISRVEVIGGDTSAIRISPFIEKLVKYKITLSEIKTIVNANNFQTMGGYLEQSYQDYAIRCLGNIENIEDLGNIVLKKIKGVPILLKDVAGIQMGYLPKRYMVYINGKQGVAFSLFKTIHASTTKVAKKARRKIRDIVESLPPGIQIVKYYDQSELIEESTRSLNNDIVVGGVLVVALLLLFLGNIRHALIIACSIPAIVMTSFLFFRLEHITLNMITLGALAVAVGMIVDDSIIVLENIQRHKQEGKNSLQAIKDGVKEIAGADISGTLTTVAAFIPFVFLPGLAGRFTAPFGIVMMTTLIISLIVSLTFIPLLLLEEKGGTQQRRPVFDGLLTFFIRFNHKLLHKFIHRKKTVIFSVIFLFLFSGGLLVFSRIAFLPEIDEGAILLEYILPPGTSLNESIRVGKVLASMAQANADVSTVYQRTGSEGGTYQVEPVNLGEIIVKLTERNKRKRSISQIINALKQRMDQIPGVMILYHQITSEKLDESMSGLPTIFGVTIYGEDYDTLLKYSGDIEKIATHTKGVGNVTNNVKYKVPELQIRPNRDKLIQYGLSAKDVMEEVRLYLGGEAISQVIKNQKNISIFLQAKNKKITVKAIKQLPIRINTQQYIPLSEIADISISYGANMIRHINLQRAITLPMEVDGSVQSIVKAMKTKIKDLHWSGNYYVTFGGQYQLFIQMAFDFIFFALMSGLIVYLIMYFQFGNFIHPLAIMIEIPFAFIGAFLAMAITRQPLNISFLIGLITLIGVSVNNGIVLIDYINKKRRQGKERMAAILEAVQTRARPIILTTVTSILALLPVAFGLGIGSKMHQPLAVCVIGGLFLNAFLTVNVLPIVYCMLEDLFFLSKRGDNNGRVKTNA